MVKSLVMRITAFLLLGLSIFIAACTPKITDFQQFLSVQQSNTFDLLIKNGQIIDGSGRPAFSADILVRGDSIVFIGEVDASSLTVEKTLDATGKIVSPGFIDTHAHGDPLGKEGFGNFLAMGVTTVTLGNDGGSPDDVAAWMNRVDNGQPDVNIGVFVGHNSIRMASGIEYDSLPTPTQLNRMGAMLREQLDAGCLGLSTGLEYLPGLYAPAYELEYLAKIVGEKGKFITSHVRNEDDPALEESLQELLAQGKYCAVHVSHLKSVFGKGEKRAEEILKLLEDAKDNGISVTADVYPYTASFTGISLLFPEWALPPYNYEQVMATRRQELGNYLRQRVEKRNGPAATLIGTAPFAGKTLAELALELNKPFEEVLMDDIKPGRASAAYFVMDEALQTRLIRDPSTMICSDGSPTMRHPRGYGSFAKIIEEYVVKLKLLSLEEAIRKMSSLPAQTMGLSGRGLLKEGYKADILIFDPLAIKATATYENPHQLAQGFDYVLVNGKISKQQEKKITPGHGKMLRRF